LRLAPTALAELIEAVVERYGEGLGQQHHLALARPLAEGVAQVDPDRLEQVVINLLDNAVKYSPDGGPIALSLDERDEGLVLSVRDQGIGLPPDAVETIFQPFGRASNAAQRYLPGMGLGLAICRSIVDRHGGRIWAESAGDGQGATFRVWLPLAESADAAGDDA
jgi:two-component system, OmpR family, sensor kinase